ncbi:unnamed protein product [Sphagnum tenellum]
MAAVMSTIASAETAASIAISLSTNKSFSSSSISSCSSCSCSSSFTISALPSRSLRLQSAAVTAAAARKNSSLQLCLGFSDSVAFGSSCSSAALRSSVLGKFYCCGSKLLLTRAVKIFAIAVGEKLPEAELAFLDEEENVHTVKVSELSRGKKLVLFAVPGAFTPTCSQKHLPGFVEKAQELRDAGVDTIACVSVNDVFVMKAWGQSVGVTADKVLLFADGLGKFTKALGATLDLTDKPFGLGIRSRRYALLAEDGVVKSLNMEEGGAFTVSGPQEILKALKAVV